MLMISHLIDIIMLGFTKGECVCKRLVRRTGTKRDLDGVFSSVIIPDIFFDFRTDILQALIDIFERIRVDMVIVIFIDDSLVTACMP